MTSTPKSTYISRWVWAYVTRHPHSTAPQITGAQTQYARPEIDQALEGLISAGYIRSEDMGGTPEYRCIGYCARIPFVVRAPTWEGVL